MFLLGISQSDIKRFILYWFSIKSTHKLRSETEWDEHTCFFFLRELRISNPKIIYNTSIKIHEELCNYYVTFNCITRSVSLDILENLSFIHINLLIVSYTYDARINESHSKIKYSIGSIHSHFVHLISNSTVDHFDIDSINALIFCTGCLMAKLHLIHHWISYDVEYIAFSSSNNRYKK